MDTLDDELHNESSSIEVFVFFSFFILQEPSFSLESNIRCRRSYDSFPSLHGCRSCDSTFNDLNENYKIAAQKIIYILYQTQFTEEEKKQEEYQLVHIPEHIIDTNTQIKTPEDPQGISWSAFDMNQMSLFSSALSFISMMIVCLPFCFLLSSL